MTSVANYVIIESDSNFVTLGDGVPVYSKTFSAPDYNGDSSVLSLMVKGFTAATTPMKVKINDFEIGEIVSHRYAADSDRAEVAQHEFTHTCTITAAIINAVGANTLEIEAEGFPESSPGNDLDDCALRGIVLFYKVDV